MCKEIQYLPAARRQAYDQAAFLRPSIASDQNFNMAFLRATRYGPWEAAKLISRYFQSKLDLYGEALLVQKITWNDLTPQERDIATTGFYLPLKHRQTQNRAILYTRLFMIDKTFDTESFWKTFWYINSVILDDSELQHGAVMILDIRKSPASSHDVIMNYLKSIQRLLESIPCRIEAVHVTYDKKCLDYFCDNLIRSLNKGYRIRHRFHFGCAKDILSSLKTFGILLEDCIDDLSQDIGPFSPDKIAAYFQERQREEDKWRQQEEPFTLFHSRVALYPNKTDVLMGRSKTAFKWHGNSLFNDLIESFAPRYAEAQASGFRADKTAIGIEIVETLQKDHGSRFLVRQDSQWVTIEDSEARRKASGSLRAELRSHTPRSSPKNGTPPTVD